MVLFCACAKVNCVSASHVSGSGCKVRRATSTASPNSPQICLACRAQVAHPNVFSSQHIGSSPGLQAWLERYRGALDSTSGPSKRKRKPSELAHASCPEGIVHHLWIEMELASPSHEPCASIWQRVLDDPVIMLCLKSWSLRPQILWTYSPVSPGQGLPGAVIPGIVLRDAGHLMLPGEALSLLAAGMPVQLLKDILSMLALFHYGGIWADLDAFCVRPPALNLNMVYAVIEPHSRHAGLVHGRKTERFSLYMMATPAGIPLYKRLADRWCAKYMAAAIKSLTSGTPGHAFSTDGTTWMDNTKEYTAAVQALRTENPDLVSLLHPWQALPFHQNLSLAQWITVKQGTEHVCRPLSDLDYTCRYPLPAWIELRTYCFAFNLWSRQWKDKRTPLFLEAVLSDVQALHDEVLAASMPLPVACPVTRMLCCMLAQLLQANAATSGCTPEQTMLLLPASYCQQQQQQKEAITADWVWKTALEVHAKLHAGVADSPDAPSLTPAA